MPDQPSQPQDADAGAVFAGAPRWGWGRWLLSLLATLAVLSALAVPAGLWWLAETVPGRAFVARQISGLEPESGLRFKVGRIDGSLFSRFQMVDVVVHDLDGPLAVIPVTEVDWEPFTLVGGAVSVNRLMVPEMRMLRQWRINPRNPKEPILPDIDIRIGRFDFPHFVLEKPVAGREETLAATGRADIRSGRLLLDTQGWATSGDRLLLLLDAEPDRDRFALRTDLRAPATGILAGLTGVAKPVAIDANGQGSWRRWRGHLNADVGEGKDANRVVALSLSANDGHFGASGTVRPSPLVPESWRALVEPEVTIDAAASRPNGSFDLRFTAQTPALSVKGGGFLDTTENEVAGARVDVVILDSRALPGDMTGSGLSATVLADGPIADPDIRWSAAAATLRMAGANGPVGANGLQAEGRVQRAQADRPLTVSFSARAATTIGLQPDMAALLVNPRLSGTMTYAGGVLRAEGVKLSTTMLTAGGSGTLHADGRLAASLDASVNRFQVPGVGPAFVRASVAVARAPGGRAAANGRFEMRAHGLDNQSVANFLGGLPTASGQFALAPGGTIAVSAVSLASPNLNVAGAHGGYDPATGRFSFDAAGAHRSHGRFTLTAAGTSAAPRATLKMPAPGFGLGLTDLVADLSPVESGLLLVANADSPQGPLDARVIVGMGRGAPLTLTIERAELAGVNATGKLIQTAAGPFAGVLQVDGRGIDANIDFKDQRGVQQVDLVARAINARLPLPTPIGIGKGSAQFTLLLVPGRPHLRGAFRMQGVTRDGLLLTNVQGTANLAGPNGVATLNASGRAGDGQPFVAASRIQTVPNGYAISLDGTVGKKPLKLEHPARMVRTKEGWELKPARLLLPRGQVEAAGVVGGQGELRLVLRDIDLAILDLFQGGLGVGGTVNGQVVVRSEKESIIPSGEADLTVKGLQRSSITGITVPVDVRLAARSEGGGLQLGAKFSWLQHDLGRVVLKVEPGIGETPTDRFLAGTMSGGVRYNGPVEPIWASFGAEGQELKGAVAVAADFAGTPANPELRGIARGKGLIYRNAAFGTEIVDIGFDGQFTGAMLKLVALEGRANGGTIKGSGFVRFGAASAIDIGLELANARVANSDTMQVTLSGPLRLKGDESAATLSGDLRVDSAYMQLVQVANSEVPQLAVRREGAVVVAQPEPTFSTTRIKLDVRVRADDRVRVEGMGLDSTWGGDVRIRGTLDQPMLLGTATLARGDFGFAGSDFTITSGRVVFNGKPLDSSIDIRAQTRAQDVTAFVTIAGTAGKPEVRFSSSPTLPEDEILARLLFGSSVADLSVTEAVQLATAIAGLQSGVDTMGKIRRSIGLDRLRLVGDNAQSGMGSGIAIGKRITRNVYAEVITDSHGNTLTTLQLTLSRIWSLFIEVSSMGNSSINLRYQREN